jgi:hypothetical protein
MFVTEVYDITCNERAQSWLDKGMVILQSSTDVLKVEPGMYSETCLASSDDGFEATDTKVEQISDTEEDEDPMQVIYPALKTKRKVSCIIVVSIVRHIS